MTFNSKKLKTLSQKNQSIINDFQEVCDYSDDDNLVEMDLLARENPSLDFAFFSLA